MEMMILALVALGVALWQWLRRRRREREVAAYATSLDQALQALLAGKPLDRRVAAADDLWGHTNESLLRLADQITRERAMLEKEKGALQSLVGDISHQTKTPLANIHLYLERLEDGDGDPALLEKMDAQVAKLDFLLASMVKVSRLETGAINIRKTRAPLAPTLAEALAAVVPQAEAKQIRLSAEVDDALVLDHDRKWTAEAVYNLLDNAVKYTPAGGGVCLRVVQGPVFTQIAVEDNGKGIARERQGAVFGRFYREPEVHDVEGAGLGLYLARGIVERQGGFIEVASEPGRGSIFTIDLPN